MTAAEDRKGKKLRARRYILLHEMDFAYSLIILLDVLLGKFGGPEKGRLLVGVEIRFGGQKQ